MYTKVTDQTFHDSPPDFKAADRKRYFYLDEHFGRQVLSSIRGDGNKVFIIVAYGYFKATGQFYNTAKQVDIDYVAAKLKLTNAHFDWVEYRSNTRDRHRQLILEAQGFYAFEQAPLEHFKQLINNAARAHKNPMRCFIDASRWLAENKVETPNYQTLTDTISNVYAEHQHSQLNRIAALLAKEDALLLDQLLEKTPDTEDQWQVHRLTLLKKFSQSTRANNIKENITAYDTLKPLYEIARPIVEQLDYTLDGLKHYATSVNRQQVFQIKRLKDPARYLHLMAFIVHQCRQLDDILVETLLVSVTAAFNEADKKTKEEYYQQRNSQTQHTQELFDDAGFLMEVIHELQETFISPTLSDSEKVTQALELFSKKGFSAEQIATHLSNVQEDLNKVSGQALMMKNLEQISLKLQRKCNDIVLRINFFADASEDALSEAITRFKQTHCKIDNKFPLEFLEKAERPFVEKDKIINKPLYKVLLFKHIADAIKRGAISVVDSYRYKQLEQYLISKERWAANRMYLLTQANMVEFSDADEFLKLQELEVDAQFSETNDHILENDFVESDGEGGYKLVSERNTMAEVLLEEKMDVELFPEEDFIHITEAINTVNKASGFLDEFEHLQHSYLKKKPEDRVFYAGIIGLGAHIGTKKLAKLSQAMFKDSTLESTQAAYFCLANAQRASDAIIRFVNQLPLASLYENEYGLQTSSDGQKWTVASESLNANYSFKYGGKDMVVSAYTFIDARSLFPHSMVISGSEREAHYMIDGLLKNDAVRSDMHSTDTHGYTEAVFGMTYLMKFSFAPRIKNVHRQQLYSFKYPSVYKQKKYMILPQKRINIELIRTHWDDILRLVASVKLGEVTASQIFKRLNSYSDDENSLYSALKEFGRIPKTKYILRYVDDVDLRKAVHKQLNKGESGNRLDKALAVGRQEYTQTLKDDQELAECCKRILKNVVVCWNFMYVSQKILRAKTPIEKMAILRKVKVSSLLAWEHFVLHGEFDFSDSKLQDSQKFDFAKLLDPTIIKEWGEE